MSCADVLQAGNARIIPKLYQIVFVYLEYFADAPKGTGTKKSERLYAKGLNVLQQVDKSVADLMRISA